MQTNSLSRPFLNISRLLPPLAAIAMLLSANCGGGGNQKNPPPPVVKIQAEHQFVDVGQTFELDGGETTDPNGEFEDIEFQWRILDAIGGTDFDDHCRDDFAQICDENADDHCSNELDRFCHTDDDCRNFGTCQLNSGTTSPDCSDGICDLGVGDEGVQATFLANHAGPFRVRLSAIGTESAGSKTIILDTYPSLFVVGPVVEFGGTEGAEVGPVADAAEFATGASEGAADPKNGNLVIIDDDLGLVRVFDLRTGETLGAFGESDRFVDDPAAIAFHPTNDRLYVAEQSGRVLIFDDSTGLLITTLGNIGAGPLAMRFSPVTGELLAVFGNGGVRRIDADGNDIGPLGETATETTQPVDIDFLGEDENFSLLIADRAGKVVRCNPNGTDCENFSTESDNLLAPGSPTAIAVNPSAEFTDNDVMIADPIGGRVIACNSNGGSCETFGDTDEIESDYSDVFFAPSSPPTTTTTVSTTTSTTLD